MSDKVKYKERLDQLNNGYKEIYEGEKRLIEAILNKLERA